MPPKGIHPPHFFKINLRRRWTFVGADYSQIELRVLAHISKDPTLVSFFGQGVDILKMVASHWMSMFVGCFR